MCNEVVVEGNNMDELAHTSWLSTCIAVTASLKVPLFVFTIGQICLSYIYTEKTLDLLKKSHYNL